MKDGLIEVAGCSTTDMTLPMQQQVETAGYLFLLLDLIAVLYEGLVYLAAFSGPALVLWHISDSHPLLLLLVALVGWLVAGMTFVLLLVLTKRFLIGDVPFGRLFLFSPRTRPWAGAHRLGAIMYRSPFSSLITENGFYRYVYFRGMGAHIDSTFFMGNGAKLPEPWAVRAGHFVVLGDNAVVSGHKLEHNVISLGKVEIGNNVLIGARAIVFPDVRIGDGATIGACSIVMRGTTIGPGETWAGVPAQKVRWARAATSD